MSVQMSAPAEGGDDGGVCACACVRAKSKPASDDGAAHLVGFQSVRVDHFKGLFVQQADPVDLFLFGRDHGGEKAEVGGWLVVANPPWCFAQLHRADVQFLNLVDRADRESLVCRQGERVCGEPLPRELSNVRTRVHSGGRGRAARGWAQRTRECFRAERAHMSDLSQVDV